MKKIRIRPVSSLVDEADVEWSIYLYADGETRWLARLKDVALAEKVAREYAVENGATFVPFPMEDYMAITAMQKALWAPRSRTNNKEYKKDTIELLDAFEREQADLCKRYRRKKRGKISCAGCPIRETTGVDNCGALPLVQMKKLLRAFGGTAEVGVQKAMLDNMRDALSVLVANIAGRFMRIE